ncbi:MAG TPA: hypothetical protein HPP56_05860 [Nitrospirae bacterium]|nr:hypothetical protein [Nitrospirota bacterium]
MKRSFVVSSLIVFVMSLVFSTVAMAEAPKVTGSASVDFMSNYVWRGIKLSKDFVIQPSVTVSYSGFSMNMWSNLDTNYYLREITGRKFKSTETDITLNYTHSFDKLSLTGGFIYYALESASDTQELYISASYDVLLKPTLTFYYDIKEGKGGYLTASIGHSFDLAKDVPLNLGAAVGYNMKNKVMSYEAYTGKNFNNFYNAELSASVSVPVTKQISITPKVAYSFALSNDSKTAISAMDVSGKDKKNIFYGGLNLSFNF